MSRHSPFLSLLALGLILLASLMAIASIDFLLPAVPHFPRIFDTTMALSQMSVACYTFGAALGFLLFGTIGAHYATWRAPVLYGAFALFGLVSWACAHAGDIYVLNALRGVQGLLSAAASVFAPAMINATFDERGAMRAMSVMGSVQSLAPGFAPIVGLWLMNVYGWTSSFYVVAVISIAVAVAFVLLGRHLHMGHAPDLSATGGGGYLTLFKNAQFRRLTLSRALQLGGLVGYMLAAPNIFVNVLGYDMRDFIIVQASAIVAFVITTNVAAHVDRRFGLERIMRAAVWLGTLTAIVFLIYALCGGIALWAIWLAGVLMNTGFGLMGNISFFLAIKSGEGDDTRASALAVLCVLLAIAGATAACAPFLQYGLISMGIVAAIMHIVGALFFFSPFSSARGDPA